MNLFHCRIIATKHLKEINYTFVNDIAGKFHWVHSHCVAFYLLTRSRHIEGARAAHFAVLFIDQLLKVYILGVRLLSSSMFTIIGHWRHRNIILFREVFLKYIYITAKNCAHKYNYRCASVRASFTFHSILHAKYFHIVNLDNCNLCVVTYFVNKELRSCRYKLNMFFT